MCDMIVETDIGNDPDDFFALCYLISAGVNIRCILVSPGDPQQIAIVRFLCKELGLDIPIGSGKVDNYKHWNTGVHERLLNVYGAPLRSAPDDLGESLLPYVLNRHPKCELFVIGPIKSIGKYLRTHPEAAFEKATMQGGFLPYSRYRPSIVKEKFEGREWAPSFNPNGDRKGFLALVDANIKEKRFVSKNLCHTVIYDRVIHESMGQPKDRASELFLEAMEIYLKKHPEKKFHDPCAAVCHLYPEVATWVKGKMVKMEGGWSTAPGNDLIAADLDYEAFWDHIRF